MKTSGTQEKPFTNVYVKNFPEISFSNEEMLKLFTDFGKITSCVIMKDSEGKSRGFGFVSFARPEDALKSIQLHTSTGFYVQPFQTKEERLAKKQRDHLKFKKSQMYFNLFVKGIALTTTDEEMATFFT